MTNQFLMNLRHQIAAGNLMAVFEQLRRGLMEHSALSPLVLTQICHYQMVKKKYMGGLLSEAAYQTEQTRIAHALLAIVDELTATDLNPFCDDALEEALSGLALGKMGKLHLFNCDRREQFRAFATFFQQQGAMPAQFYFIAGSPAQKPDSFTERMIYEIMEDKQLLEDDAVVEYERAAGWMGPYSTDRVKFRPLPIGLNAESSQVKFKKYFSERMAPYQAGAQLDTFFEAPGKCLQFKYIAFTFQIDSEQWGPELRTYIQWMVGFFRQHSGGQLRLLVFIVLYMPAAPTLLQSNEALADIQDIVHQASDCCLLLENLKPVGREELSAWFRSISNASDPLIIEAVIDTFAKSIPQHGSDFRIAFDMMELEPLFERVYLQHLKR